MSIGLPDRDRADLLWASLLRLRHGAIPNASAVCATLLARVAEGADIIAALRPGSRLEHQLVRRVPPARLFCINTDPNESCTRPGSTITGTIVGAQDRDRPQSESLPWPHAPISARRLRQLDTMFPHYRRVGLLVSEQPNTVSDLLRGASGILKDAAPPFVLDLSSLPVAKRLTAWSAAAEMIAGASYTWHDAMLAPCEVDPSVIETLLDPVVIALPIPEPRLTPARLAAFGWTSPIGEADPVAASVITVFDADLPCTGFYAAESDAHSVWRWTGDGPVCCFALRVPGPGTWRLALDVAHWGVIEATDALQVDADGHVLPCLDGPISPIQGGLMRFGDIVIPPFADHGRLVVTLSTPRPRSIHTDQVSTKGLALARAILERIA